MTQINAEKESAKISGICRIKKTVSRRWRLLAQKRNRRKSARSAGEKNKKSFPQITLI